MFMMCQMIGRPPISTSGFGRTTVSSDSRDPLPPARITAFNAPGAYALGDAPSGVIVVGCEGGIQRRRVRRGRQRLAAGRPRCEALEGWHASDARAESRSNRPVLARRRRALWLRNHAEARF